MAKVARALTLTLFLVAGRAVGVAAATASTDDVYCWDDLWERVIELCWDYVSRYGHTYPPGPACCSAVQHVGTRCTCRYVTPNLLTYFDMDAYAMVAAYCQRPLKPCSQCGVYKVPCNLPPE